MRKIVAALCLLLGSFSANAGGLDIALSNETANLSVLLNPYQQFIRAGGTELGVGGFISEQGDRLAHATLMARGFRQSDSGQYNLGAGVKLLGGDVTIPASVTGVKQDEAVGALALGMQFGLLLASSRHNPIEVMFEGFMAPSITSFSDAERFSELSARLQIEVIPQARAYIGYRRMRFDTDDFRDVQLDRSVHMGIKLTF